MVLQNYLNLIEMTSNIFHIIAFGVGFKCPRKIHLNTQWVGGGWGGGLRRISPVSPIPMESNIFPFEFLLLSYNLDRNNQTEGKKSILRDDFIIQFFTMQSY